MSHKEKPNPFTRLFGAGTIALLALVAVTTFAPANSTLSAASLLNTLTSLTTKAGSSVNLGAAQGALTKATSPANKVALPKTSTTKTSVTTAAPYGCKSAYWLRYQEPYYHTIFTVSTDFSLLSTYP